MVVRGTPRRLVLYKAYQAIISPGLPVAPLLLRELKTHPRQWFWAPHAITGENPPRPVRLFDRRWMPGLTGESDGGLLSNQ